MTSKEPEPLDTIAPLLIGVQTHPERDVSLESLAREWGYSPAHFHRLFTETVGETPKAHVERVRLERAAFRVAVESISFLEIALEIGYRNHETFTRAFKRQFGVTPTAYRRSARRAQKERMERMRTFRSVPTTTIRTCRRSPRVTTFGRASQPSPSGAASPIVACRSRFLTTIRP
jgi:AraC family transcriptional regulator